MPQHQHPKTFVRNGSILFAICIIFAYTLYPHWVTFSLFAAKWYTFLLFIAAMAITMAQLWFIGTQLRQHAQLKVGGTFLCASALCVTLIICVPYMGGSTQKSIHNAAVVLFVLLAAFGVRWVGRRLRNTALGIMSVALVATCALDLTFLARYNAHPVYPWVWVVLQLAVTGILMSALYTIASTLERKTKA